MTVDIGETWSETSILELLALELDVWNHRHRHQTTTKQNGWRHRPCCFFFKWRPISAKMAAILELFCIVHTGRFRATTATGTSFLSQESMVYRDWFISLQCNGIKKRVIFYCSSSTLSFLEIVIVDVAFLFQNEFLLRPPFKKKKRKKKKNRIETNDERFLTIFHFLFGFFFNRHLHRKKRHKTKSCKKKMELFPFSFFLFSPRPSARSTISQSSTDKRSLYTNEFLFISSYKKKSDEDPVKPRRKPVASHRIP